MKAPDILQLASVGLLRNKMRSGLTAVGVTVGVFALITIIALGLGLESAIIRELTDNESQTRIIVRPGFGKLDKKDPKVEGVTDPAKLDRLRKAIAKRRRGGPAQMRRTIVTAEALAEMAKMDHVTLVRPLAIDRFKVKFRDHELDGALSYGVQPTSRQWNERVILGDPFKVHGNEPGVWIHEFTLYTWGYRTDEEQEALVGESVTLLRPRESLGVSAYLSAAKATLQAQGIEIPVDSQTEAFAERMIKTFAGGGTGPAPDGPDLAVEATIRGVIRERIESDGFEVWEDSFSMQTDLFLPQKFAEELFLQIPSNVTRGYNVAAIEVDSAENVKSIEEALRKDGFRTVSVGTILERVGKAMAIITAVVSGLTMIALLVAMLGIVNTMVMNVSERTREIGVLKALGGTDGQVRRLFIVESALIGLTGGVAGVSLALLASLPADAYNKYAIYELSQYHYDGSVFSFPPWLIGLGLGFALVLSILAALGPATRASRVDPVTALRDE